MHHDHLTLLLRVNKSWYDGIPDDELYEVTRGWWVMSLSTAARVTRVLAVAGGVVREVFEPEEWQRSRVEGSENRVGFRGAVAHDRQQYVGRNVAHLFRQGSANPVRYVPLDVLQAATTAAPSAGSDSYEPVDHGRLVEPGLLERVLPLLDAFEHDLLWHQSRAGQELFHSNTLAWLLAKHPIPAAPLLDLLGGRSYVAVAEVNVWRERRNLDLVIDPTRSSPKIVVENKLYSVPYAAQLEKYNDYPLPWSPAHGSAGAADTRYVLLSLLRPSFPLPVPWVHVDYRDVAGALDRIDAEQLGRTADQFRRYRALVHRLVELSEAVDPAQALDEQFSATEVVAQLPGGGLDGAIARMRFSGLAQLVQSHPRVVTPKPFEVGGNRGGLISYRRRLTANRAIGWQFQENQLRYQVTLEDDDLQGPTNRAAREAIVEAEHLDFFDHVEVEAVLGQDLRSKTYRPGAWLAFNPDFVYRHRPVRSTVSTAKLTEALVVMTERVDRAADRVGYDSA